MLVIVLIGLGLLLVLFGWLLVWLGCLDLCCVVGMLVDYGLIVVGMV